MWIADGNVRTYDMERVLGEHRGSSPNGGGTKASGDQQGTRVIAGFLDSVSRRLPEVRDIFGRFL